MSRFELSTTISDDDFDALFVLNWKCFGNDPVMTAFSPGGLDPAHRSSNVEDFKHGVFGGPTTDPERAYAVLKDPNTNAFVAFISAKIYPGLEGINDRALAEEPEPISLPRIGDDEEREFYEWWVFDVVRERRLDQCCPIASPETLESGFYDNLGFRVAEKYRVVDENEREGPPIVIMSKAMGTSFELSATIRELEWDALFVLNWACFSSNPSIAAFSPGGVSPAYRTRNVEYFRNRAFTGPIKRLYAVLRNLHNKALRFISFVSARVYCGSKGVLKDNPSGTPIKLQLPQGPPEEYK
ncbi:hypothetical protein AOQ84DRAFT_375767 [Glonium stellatum]|uniref:Uncharacterized protein n=1 Tax=Glonium stellatum TaxID=574774 RepID=A0A8E2F2U2_9PEZI|nr:hypothetical protein AOQ84DRAFT_375767 [Glonium stellatum]